MRQRNIDPGLQVKDCGGDLWVPSESLSLRESFLGLKGRPSSCRLTLNGAPLRTTKALELLKPSVLCLRRFSNFSRLACWIFNSAYKKKRTFFFKECPAYEVIKSKLKDKNKRNTFSVPAVLTFH